MENDIVFYTTTYLFTRLAIVAAFAYAFYRVLRPSPIAVRSDRSGAGSQRQQRIVFDDHC